MVITSLHAQNFKSWQNTGDLRFSKLTGFFGTNSSGKTSLIQLLLLLKQTVDSSDRKQVLNLGNERSMVELGTFGEVIFRHEGRRPLEIGWSWVPGIALSDPEKPQETLFEADAVAFETKIVYEDRMIVDSFAYSLGPDRFTLTREHGDDYRLAHEGPTSFEFLRNRGRSGPLPQPERFYRFQLSGKYRNAAFLADLELALERTLDRLLYLGPLREYPQRQYTWGGSEPSDVGWHGERAMDALLASRRTNKKISRGPGRRKLTVEQYVAHWLQALGVIHSFSITELKGSLYQVRVQRSEGSPDVSLTDVGFGVSQLLPVLVLCYFAPEGSTLVLEQPEIHLHPSVQAGLADVFIDAIQKRDLQIVLESHSEYLLKRLQRRIAETERPYDQFSEDDVALYFCTHDRGESKAEELEVDTYGNIVNWPRDFFGDEMEDLAARTRAAARRKMAG